MVDDANVRAVTEHVDRRPGALVRVADNYPSPISKPPHVSNLPEVFTGIGLSQSGVREVLEAQLQFVLLLVAQTQPQRDVVAEVHPGAETSIAAAIARRDDVQSDTGFEEPPAPDVPASCRLQPQLQTDVRLSGITHGERAPYADGCLDLPGQPARPHAWRTTPRPQRAGRES